MAFQQAVERCMNGRNVMTDSSDRSDRQSREIGGWGAFSTVAGSMIGIGIFLVPPIVAQKLPTAFGFFSVWIVAALAALSGATAYAELGGLFPEAGGDYVFQREVYGRATAFASGWVLFGGIFTGSIAALAVPLGTHQLDTLLDAAGIPFAPEATVPYVGLTGAQTVGVAIVVGLTLVNSFRARVSSVVQTVTTILPVIGLAVGGLFVLAWAGGPPAEPPPPAGPSSPGDYLLSWVDAYTAAYFAFSGWNAIIYVSGEVKDPGKTIPVGLLGGTLVVTAVYLVLCAAFVVTLGFGGLAGVVEAGTATARAFGGETAGLFVTAVVAVALLASVNATILGGARVAYAMARREAFPSVFGELNRFDVPVRALWLQAAWACLLVVTGTFEQILDLVGLAMMFVGVMTVATVWFLRARRPEMERPYEALGFPWFPAFYLVSSGIVIVVRLYDSASSSEPGALYPLIGLGIFGLTYLFGWLWINGRENPG